MTQRISRITLKHKQNQILAFYIHNILSGVFQFLKLILLFCQMLNWKFPTEVMYIVFVYVIWTCQCKPFMFPHLALSVVAAHIKSKCSFGDMNKCQRQKVRRVKELRENKHVIYWGMTGERPGSS